MSSQFAEWVEIAEETGGDFSDYSMCDILEDWFEDRAQRDAERDELVARLVETANELDNIIDQKGHTGLSRGIRDRAYTALARARDAR